MNGKEVYKKIMNDWEHYRKVYKTLDKHKRRDLKNDIYAFNDLLDLEKNRLWEVLNSDVGGNKCDVR